MSGFSRRSAVAVLMGLTAQTAQANSAGDGVPCLSAMPGVKLGGAELGKADRGLADLTAAGDDEEKKKEAKLHLAANYKMWWAAPPMHNAASYTVRTGDGSPGTDRTSYVPGIFQDIYVRALTEGEKYQGLVMKAVDGAGKTVGEWETSGLAPFRYGQDSAGDWCLTHSNGEYKNYLNVFRFKAPPVGTGTITIHSIIKEGLAFPVLDGNFYYPNDAPLVLTEAAPMAQQKWFHGAPGQSCTEVCADAGGTCSDDRLQTIGRDPDALLAAVTPLFNCEAPLLWACSDTTPALGTKGCFVHKPDCGATAAPTPEYIKPDPCLGLDARDGNVGLDPNECVRWKYITRGQNGSPESVAQGEAYNLAYTGLEVHLCNEGNNRAQTNGPDTNYGDLVITDRCMPKGGWVTPPPTNAPPTPARRPMADATCDAKQSGVEDGGRLCPCDGATKTQVEGKTDEPGTGTISDMSGASMQSPAFMGAVLLAAAMLA